MACVSARRVSGQRHGSVLRSIFRAFRPPSLRRTSGIAWTHLTGPRKASRSPPGRKCAVRARLEVASTRGIAMEVAHVPVLQPHRTRAHRDLWNQDRDYGGKVSIPIPEVSMEGRFGGRGDHRVGEMGGHGPRGKISIERNEISRIDRSQFGRKVSMRRGLDLHRYLFGKRSIDASADRLPRDRYLGEGGIDGRGLASARARRSATNQGGRTRFQRHGHAPSRRRGVVPGDHAHVRRGSSRGGAPGEDRCAERKGEGEGSRR
eukprot:scaffold2696_cov333-Pavlova_lutheri.AAC.5